MNSNQRTKRGFTLLELLVVIFLAALTIGIAATRFSGAASSSELKAESRKLIALLRHTRAKAVSQSQSMGLIALAEGTGYQITPNGDEVELPEGIHLSVQLGAGEIVVNEPGIYFYPDGSSNGGSVALTSPVGEFSVDVNWLTGEVAVANQE